MLIGRVIVVGLSAGTAYSLTVYTEIDDVIVSGVDVNVSTLPRGGESITYWKLPKTHGVYSLYIYISFQKGVARVYNFDKL